MLDRTALLATVYGHDAGRRLDEQLDLLVARHAGTSSQSRPWSEADAWLIAYPDQFSEPGAMPLQA